MRRAVFHIASIPVGETVQSPATHTRPPAGRLMLLLYFIVAGLLLGKLAGGHLASD